MVEHKGRLTRFGFRYIELLYPECEIVVINPCEDKQDLFEDLVSLITSFCTRIYGHRRCRRKTVAIMQTLKEGDMGDDTCRTTQNKEE